MGGHAITMRLDGMDVAGSLDSEAELDDFVRRLYCASEGVWPSDAPAATEKEPLDTAVEAAAPIPEPPKHESVSARQSRIAELLREGRNRAEIVDLLCITPSTFANDRKALKMKGLL